MNRKELVEQIFAKKSFLCVGLDTDINKLPKCITESEEIQGAEAEMMFKFNQAIIDATAPYCVAYKPNLAFYESRGIDGMIAFENTIKYLKSHYPNHFIIADAKRGDIGNTSKMYAQTFFEIILLEESLGNTSKMYAQTFFEEYNLDSVTVAPYMGEDSVKPFLEYEGKWVILLALTSNKGSHDFQLTEDKEGERLFEKVLKKSQEWGNDENMMYVVGATQGQMFEDIRKVAPNHFLLVPGVGAQGGSLQEVCKYGIIKDCGLLVNSSRGIIYASNGDDFAEVAGQKAKELQEQMAAELAKL